MDISRRTVLGGSAAVALAGLAPGIRLVRHRPDVRYPVTLGSADAVITGRLYQPHGKPRGLIVCIPGLTYAAYYWGFPHRGNNFAAALTARGWAVLALNLPGTDPSTGYPPAADLTIANLAAAVHQVLKVVRPPRARPLILAGHSMGSSVALEAAGMGAVDALILTGFTHNPSAAGQALARSAVVPASILTAGYITTAEGQRWKAFLQTDADPAVVALDEKLKTTASATELISLASSFDPVISRALSLPVMIVNGSRDVITYGPGAIGTVEHTEAEEAAYWTAAPEIWLLPGAPHDINLARNASDWFDQAAWFAAGVRR